MLIQATGASAFGTRGDAQPVFDGPDSDLCAAPEPQLAQDAGDVPVDGALADDEAGRDLTVAESARDERCYLTLSRRQEQVSGRNGL